jgi:hypothetical protein
VRMGRVLTGGLVVLALLAGCQQQQAESKAPLEARVAKYWALKQSKGWEEVYEQYVDPQAKETLKKDAFLGKRRLSFDVLSFRVTEAKEEGDTAKVAVENEVNFPIKSPAGEMQLIKKQVTTTETWVRRDGAWYIQLDE